MLGLKAGLPAFRSKLYRLAVWRVAIGVCPCFLALTEGGEISELLLGYQMFERRKPVLEIARASIRFTPNRSRLELVAKGGCPLRPREVPRCGQLSQPPFPRPSPQVTSEALP